MLPAADGIAKFLITDFHVAQLVWGRLLFQSLLVVGWLAARRQLHRVHIERPGMLVLCAALIWIANFPIIYSLAFLPLAAAFALVMTAPLMVTALSVVLLREQVGMHQWIAVAAGFCGALVIIRPGLGAVHWAAVLPIVSAALFALYQIGVRTLSTTHSSTNILLFASLLPLLASSAVVPLTWSPPSATSWGLMALMGVGAGIGHFMLIAALGHAPASLLAPFMYVQLVSSAVFGLLVFGDVPDAMTILGAAMIVGAGLYGMRHAATEHHGD